MVISNSLTKEVSFSTLGAAIGASSYVIYDLTREAIWESGSSFLRDVVCYSCWGGVISGTVLSVYSIFRLAKRILDQNNGLSKPLTLATLGVVFTAVFSAAQEFFSDYCYFECESLLCAMSTNFAWSALVIASIAGSFFTIYATYRIGEYLMREPAVKA